MAGPWEKYGQAAPQAPVGGDVIVRQADPYRDRDQAMQEESNARANAAAARQAAADERAAAAAERAVNKDGQGSVDEKKIATLTTRIAGGANDILGITANNPEAQMPGMVEAVRGDLMPGGIGGIVSRGVAGGDRRSVHDAQRDMLDALLTLGTGAAYNAEQLSGQMAAYFPQYNDTPEEIRIKNNRLLRQIEAAKVNAGPAWESVAPAIAPFMATLGDQANSRDNDDSGAAGGAARSEGGAGSAPAPLPGHFDERGQPIDTSFEGMAYDENGEPLGLIGSATDTSPDAPREEVQRLASLDGSQAGLSGLGTLAKQGLSLGLSDEAAGIGGAIASGLRGDFSNIGQSYLDNRDASRLTIERARQANPYTGAAAELLGGAALPGKAIAGANSLLGAARTGATAGGLGGFGYGEGAAGSGINALGGAVIGGGVGAGAQMAGNALAGFAANRAARASSSVDVADVARAGQAEGVTVNRAMVDPGLANRVTGVDSSLVAGGSVQRGMREIEGQIEGRVQELGRGGQALDDLAAGDTALRAGERFIEKSGKSAKVKYDRAERLAGDAKVTPRESLTRIDEMLSVLGETPKTNQAEIQFLQGLKSDFSKDLSVGALRRQRTALRKRISNGGLTFGEDEARVLAIMDGAADDIRNGLTAQGKGPAAKAFDTADKAYRARMEYIGGTLQKIMGKRNANLPPERAFATLQSMAKGKDAGGLRRFYSSLSPDERGDVAATFAEQLGKNTKGDFSIAHFLSQSEKMSDSAIRTIFGSEGAQSIANLRTLGKEVNRVTSAMNSRTSKSSVGEDYRSWIVNAVLGGGGGFIADGLTTAGIGTAVTLGAKAGRDMMSARALMSPNITKWLKQAPRTADPKAINAHFKRLGDVAKLEPALAGEIDVLRDSLLKAANDNVGRSAAAGEREKQQ